MTTEIRASATGLRFTRLPRRFADWCLAAAERQRQRRALAALDEVQLRDLGLSRAEALGEAEKPFWQG